MFKIFDFGLHDRQNGREMAMGDGTILRSEDGYAGSNDDGEWKPLYASVSEEAMAAALAERGFKMVAIEDQDPEPTPDPQPDPDPGPDPVDPDPADPDPVDPPVAGDLYPDDPIDGGLHPDGYYVPPKFDIPAVPADVVDVTPATLAGALASNKTFRLAPGDYGDLPDLPDNVALIGPEDRSAIIRRIGADGVSGVVLDSLSLSPFFAEKQDNARRVRFDNSADILVQNCDIVAERADGVIPTGRGIVFYDSTRITVRDNRITGWHKGLQMNSVDHYVVERNLFDDITSDGMTSGQNCTDGLIQDNDFGRRTAVGGHGDRFVLQRVKDAKQVGILIRHNRSHLGDGLHSQTYYADGADGLTYHEKVSLVDNVMFVSHTNAIFMHYLDGMVLLRNTLIRMERNPGDESKNGYGATVPDILIENCPNAVLRDNLSPTYSSEAAPFEGIDGNEVLNPEDYSDWFVSLGIGPDGLTAWKTVPGAFDGKGSRQLW